MAIFLSPQKTPLQILRENLKKLLWAGVTGDLSMEREELFL